MIASSLARGEPKVAKPRTRRPCIPRSGCDRGQIVSDCTGIARIILRAIVREHDIVIDDNRSEVFL
jgi:hypothetical protein